MIHQCLHGYSEGHDLLASSLALSKEQRTRLAQLTDLSGPAPVQGFDGYLSGFPLSGGVYVLARTWYATELPRPGCVWTHSLLLGGEDLTDSNVVALSRLHRRPTVSEGFADYRAGIELIEDSVAPSTLLPSELKRVLDAVYGDSESRICISSDTSSEFEPVCLAIWNQQWPSLRAAFAFTTGMLGRGQWPFDLQVVPTKNRRQFHRRDGFALIDASDALENGWAQACADDAVGIPSSFRSFLWTSGRYVANSRRAFRRLCELYLILQNTVSRTRARAAYDFLAASASDAGGVGLAAVVFGGQTTGDYLNEVDSLECVALDDQGVIDESTQRIRQRAESISSFELEELVIRLQAATPSERSAAIRDVFIDRCDKSALSRLPEDLLAEVVIHRPALARTSETWQRSEEGSLKILKTVLSRGPITVDLAYGLLLNGSPRLLYEAQSSSSASWIRAGKQLAESGGLSPASEEFLLSVLWKSKNQVRAELTNNKVGPFLKLASAALDVSVQEATNFPIENIDTTVNLPNLFDGGAELRACAFMVMVGLVREERTAASLIAEGFSPVYQAAKDQSLPWDLWKQLESQLSWHLFDWDRCARLVEGAVVRFVEHRWPHELFLKTFRTEEQFGRAIVELNSYLGRQYLEELQRVVDNAPNIGLPFQVDRLMR